MKIKLSASVLVILVIFLGIFLLGCSPKKAAVNNGKYYNSDRSAYIEITDSNFLQLHNIEITTLQKEYEQAVFTLAVWTAQREGKPLTEEEEKQALKSAQLTVHIQQQFADKKASFELIPLDDPLQQLSSPVENTDIFFVMEYNPTVHTIVLNELVYTLEEGQ